MRRQPCQHEHLSFCVSTMRHTFWIKKHLEANSTTKNYPNGLAGFSPPSRAMQTDAQPLTGTLNPVMTCINRPRVADLPPTFAEYQVYCSVFLVCNARARGGQKKTHVLAKEGRPPIPYSRGMCRPRASEPTPVIISRCRTQQ